MYQNLSHFLQRFSAEYPLLWALLVMVVIAGVALFLYGFWELVLRGLSRIFGSRNRDARNTQA
jgi:NADH:ubiquinone oxidoreductase subunit 5 (subunit L)/multisubunit Na+/H+ antiporter MnhA subunit